MDIPPEGSSSWERQTVATSTEEQEFLDWLRRNGALFHDVLWPSSDTQSGMRGAIAARNIDSGVSMRTASVYSLVDGVERMCIEKSCGSVNGGELLFTATTKPVVCTLPGSKIVYRWRACSGAYSHLMYCGYLTLVSPQCEKGQTYSTDDGTVMPLRG